MKEQLYTNGVSPHQRHSNESAEANGNTEDGAFHTIHQGVKVH